MNVRDRKTVATVTIEVDDGDALPDVTPRFRKRAVSVFLIDVDWEYRPDDGKWTFRKADVHGSLRLKSGDLGTRMPWVLWAFEDYYEDVWPEGVQLIKSTRPEWVPGS